MKTETIINCGVEGGDWTLIGSKGAEGGWRFRATRDESTLIEFMTDEDAADFEPRSETEWVDSWEAALKLFDKYRWHTFHPVRVHPDFAQQIWAAVQKRVGRDKRDQFLFYLFHPKLWRTWMRESSTWTNYNGEYWRRLCRGGGRFGYSDFE
jgi:hypothetical protein